MRGGGGSGKEKAGCEGGARCGEGKLWWEREREDVEKEGGG